MYKDLKFPVLIVHRDIKADTVAGERVRGIAHELEQDGFSILSTASSAEGASSLPPTTAWPAFWSPPKVPGKTSACCGCGRTDPRGPRAGAAVPIFALGEW